MKLKDGLKLFVACAGYAWLKDWLGKPESANKTTSWCNYYSAARDKTNHNVVNNNYNINHCYTYGDAIEAVTNSNMLPSVASEIIRCLPINWSSNFYSGVISIVKSDWLDSIKLSTVREIIKREGGEM